jgi:hypothetical protein
VRLFFQLVILLSESALAQIGCSLSTKADYFLASMALVNYSGVYISPCIHGCLLISSKLMRFEGVDSRSLLMKSLKSGSLMMFVFFSRILQYVVNFFSRINLQKKKILR